RLFGAKGPLPKVQARLRGGRRAGCHSAAHQLSPESDRGCLCLPGQRLGRGPTKVFLEYMNRLNALRTQPEFYNTLTTNCTTNIWVNTHVNAGRVPWSWKILVSGYVPEYLYELGRLQTMGLSFPELQQRAHVNARAQAADAAADF